LLLKVKIFADLRDKVHPKPAIGEPILLDVAVNTSIEDIISKIKLSTDDIAIIFVNGVHKTLDYQVKEEDKVSLFSPVGGG
jgi:molybdopterin converting factor small subunit